jgi:hypothetical protein
MDPDVKSDRILERAQMAFWILGFLSCLILLAIGVVAIIGWAWYVLMTSGII